MTNKEFMNFVENKQKKKLELLDSKGAEYSKNDNRFHNFDIAKKLYDLIDNKDTPYFVYYANLCKQFTGIIDILNGKDYTLELLAEKFGDCENYLTLLEAKLTFDLDNKRNFNLEDLGDFRVEPKKKTTKDLNIVEPKVGEWIVEIDDPDSRYTIGYSDGQNIELKSIDGCVAGVLYKKVVIANYRYPTKKELKRINKYLELNHE